MWVTNRPASNFEGRVPFFASIASLLYYFCIQYIPVLQFETPRSKRSALKEACFGSSRWWPGWRGGGVYRYVPTTAMMRRLSWCACCLKKVSKRWSFKGATNRWPTGAVCRGERNNEITSHHAAHMLMGTDIYHASTCVRTAWVCTRTTLCKASSPPLIQSI